MNRNKNETTRGNITKTVAQPETVNVETYSKLHIHYNHTFFSFSHFPLSLWATFIAATTTCNCLHRTNWCDCKHIRTKKELFYLHYELCTHCTIWNLDCIVLLFGVCVSFLGEWCIFSYYTYGILFCIVSSDKSLKFGFKRFCMHKCN